MTGTKQKIHIGTSGYQYDHWKEVFYPENMPAEKWFEYYSRHFDTVEINNQLSRAAPGIPPIH